MAAPHCLGCLHAHRLVEGPLGVPGRPALPGDAELNGDRRAHPFSARSFPKSAVALGAIAWIGAPRLSADHARPMLIES